VYVAEVMVDNRGLVVVLTMLKCASCSGKTIEPG